MTEPTPARLNTIADNLSRPIPPPKPKAVKEQLSWRTLRVGQRLSLRERWFRPDLDLQPGTVLTVGWVTSGGVELTTDPDLGKVNTVSWTDPKWERMFEKLAKIRRSKK